MSFDTVKYTPRETIFHQFNLFLHILMISIAKVHCVVMVAKSKKRRYPNAWDYFSNLLTSTTLRQQVMSEALFSDFTSLLQELRHMSGDQLNGAGFKIFLVALIS